MDTQHRIREWIESVGRADLMEELSISAPSAITNAIRLGRMPAWWQVPATRLAERKGVSPPAEDLFTRFGSRVA